MNIDRPNSELHKSLTWDNPKGLLLVESERYPYQRAIRKIIADIFEQYIPVGNTVFEVGAGTGYLKTLVPEVYHPGYISSDYNIANLLMGQTLRDLTIQQASAYALPLEDGSQSTIVNMDAYDTLHDLGGAMAEVARVLKPEGKFIHFQVNYPSDDTVEEEYPKHIFFPAKYDLHGRASMVGVTREDLQKGLEKIKTPFFRPLIQRFLDNPERAYVDIMQAGEQAPKFTDMTHDVLDAMTIDRVVIPSLPEYFRSKLEAKSKDSGLMIVESGFRGTTLRLPRSEYQRAEADRNQFTIEQGSSTHRINAELKVSQSTEVIEKASILVFIAQKPAA